MLIPVSFALRILTLLCLAALYCDAFELLNAPLRSPGPKHWSVSHPERYE